MSRLSDVPIFRSLSVSSVLIAVRFCRSDYPMSRSPDLATPSPTPHFTPFHPTHTPCHPTSPQACRLAYPTSPHIFSLFYEASAPPLRPLPHSSALIRGKPFSGFPSFASFVSFV